MNMEVPEPCIGVLLDFFTFWIGEAGTVLNELTY
jgi:hypothetical protein